MKISLLSIILVFTYQINAYANNVINDRIEKTFNFLGECIKKQDDLCEKKLNTNKSLKYGECRDKNRKKCYKKFPEKKYQNLVKEKKDGIILKIENGKDIFLKNKNYKDYGYDAMTYEFITFIPEINYYVVRENGHEWTNVFFVNKKNGEKFYFGYCNFYDEMLIKFSPDSKKFACMNMSESYGFFGISITRIEKDKLVKEYDKKDISYWSKSIEWIDNQTLKYSYDDKKEGAMKMISKHKIIKYKNGKWEEGKEIKN